MPSREDSTAPAPIGEVVYELTGRTHEQLLADLPRQLRLVASEFDAFDIHLLAAASERRADLICSANRAPPRRPARRWDRGHRSRAEFGIA